MNIGIGIGFEIEYVCVIVVVAVVLRAIQLCFYCIVNYFVMDVP